MRSDDTNVPEELTPREQHFLEEYAIDFNPTEAALRSGAASAKAQAEAASLLRQPAVAAAVERLRAARQQRRRVTADRVIEEYARIAFADLRDFLDWGPKGVTLRAKEHLNDWQAGAVADIEPPGANGKGARLRLHDKKAALDALARHLGLFRPNDQPSEEPTIGGRDPRAVLRERLLRLAKKSGD
ncbi:MAG: terminase small subunit [Stellaceae bacterium]